MYAPHADFSTRAHATRAAVAAASVRGDDAETFLRHVIGAVRRAIPHDAGGWTTTDPGTALWTAGVMHGLPAEVGTGFVENELLECDVLKFRDLARGRRRTGVLSVALDGDRQRSPRFRAMYAPHGIGDELRFAVTADGMTFANACLLRSHGAPAFTAQEAALLESLSGDVVHGLRCAMVRHPTADGQPASIAPGVLHLDDDLRVLAANDPAEAWLERMDATVGPERPLPHAVLSTVRRAGAYADGRVTDGPPRVRVRASCGTWLAVHASRMTDEPRTWAVVIEAARPGELLPLMACAHDLTRREREVLGLLLRGEPDKRIAERLVISVHTARDHVRHVKAKMGVGSRGELQALICDRMVGDLAFAGLDADAPGVRGSGDPAAGTCRADRFERSGFERTASCGPVRAGQPARPPGCETPPR